MRNWFDSFRVAMWILEKKFPDEWEAAEFIGIPCNAYRIARAGTHHNYGPDKDYVISIIHAAERIIEEEPDFIEKFLPPAGNGAKPERD